MSSITPAEYASKTDSVSLLLDIRRDDDFQASTDILDGAEWKDPTIVDQWISSVPKEGSVIIYCVRGGGVSQNVVKQLIAEGINARYIEGGIEGIKDAGGPVTQK